MPPLVLLRPIQQLNSRAISLSVHAASPVMVRVPRRIHHGIRSSPKVLSLNLALFRRYSVRCRSCEHLRCDSVMVHLCDVAAFQMQRR